MGCLNVNVNWLVNELSVEVSNVEMILETFVNIADTPLEVSSTVEDLSILLYSLTPPALQCIPADNQLDFTAIKSSSFDVDVKIVCEAELGNYLMVIEGFLLTMDDEYIQVLNE